MRIARARFRRTLVALLFAAACTSDRMVSPEGPGSLTADFVPVPGGSVTVPLPNQGYPDASVPLPSFPRKVLLRASLSGNVSTTRTPYNPVDGPIQPGAPRTFGPAGYYYGPPQYGPSIQGCGAQLRVQYSGSGTQYSIPCAPNGSTDAADSTQGFLYAQGGGSALRTAAAPGSGCTYPGAGTGPCFYILNDRSDRHNRADRGRVGLDGDAYDRELQRHRHGHGEHNPGTSGWIERPVEH
jgi:hypothetical protein